MPVLDGCVPQNPERQLKNSLPSIAPWQVFARVRQHRVVSGSIDAMTDYSQGKLDTTRSQTILKHRVVVGFPARVRFSRRGSLRHAARY